MSGISALLVVLWAALAVCSFVLTIILLVDLSTEGWQRSMIRKSSLWVHDKLSPSHRWYRKNFNAADESFSRLGWLLSKDTYELKKHTQFTLELSRNYAHHSEMVSLLALSDRRGHLRFNSVRDLRKYVKSIIKSRDPKSAIMASMPRSYESSTGKTKKVLF